jgi:hypothetical protein
MRVRILKSCFFVREQRQVHPDEIVEVQSLPEKAIQDGRVEVVLHIPNDADLPNVGYE